MTQTQDPQHSPQDSLHAEQAGYKQTLGRRHVQMIAIGGAIGTGLFLGSASRLHNNGPALLFSYAFVGVIGCVPVAADRHECARLDRLRDWTHIRPVRAGPVAPPSRA